MPTTATTTATRTSPIATITVWIENESGEDHAYAVLPAEIADLIDLLSDSDGSLIAESFEAEIVHLDGSLSNVVSLDGLRHLAEVAA